MNKPLKILHTEAAMEMGGQEIYIYRHMHCMRACGHQVQLLCQPGSRLAPLARAAGFEVTTLRMGGPWRLLTGIWKVYRLARRQHFDVVNTTSRRDTLIAASAARLAGVPLVVRSRHLMSAVNSLLTYTVLPHRVITVSRFVGTLLAHYGVPAVRIGVVPPVAPPPPWLQHDADRLAHLQQVRHEVRAELSLDTDAIVVGCVAVLRAPKGHAALFEAIAPLCRADPRLHLVVVGDGEPMMGRLRALRARLGLDAQVHLLGYRDDACRLMSGFDVFALATEREAAGTVFVEAAQAGLPVVATRVGGVPEMVLDGINAVLVPPGDVPALRDALRALVDHPERRAALGQASWQWMQGAHAFTETSQATRTEHYYYQWLKEMRK
ncbi:glycosyltransferase family 4 protein [Xanthomonas theicola]|uniref:Glycosyltransferase family 1 protein n=1 Tax=Xanthomonas theicola TaxID=56464 RepID=A0A2S6ZEU6_9XANT|nr:glycosyltransferase family 4 protein [Xanthomonas theicola]PPT90797.1 glycosyltransferase family 1 protein [Xanthomonas theicola]QNH23804.1 glycosyltransferase family 4 protein [Xanthomonas theicola]